MYIIIISIIIIHIVIIIIITLALNSVHTRPPIIYSRCAITPSLSQIVFRPHRDLELAKKQIHILRKK